MPCEEHRKKFWWSSLSQLITTVCQSSISIFSQIDNIYWYADNRTLIKHRQERISALNPRPIRFLHSSPHLWNSLKRIYIVLWREAAVGLPRWFPFANCPFPYRFHCWQLSMSYLQPFASASCRFNAAMISKIVFSAVLLAVAAATPYRDCGKKNRPTLCSFASTELEPGFCADVSRINGHHLFVRRSRLHYTALYHPARTELHAPVRFRRQYVGFYIYFLRFSSFVSLCLRIVFFSYKDAPANSFDPYVTGTFLGITAPWPGTFPPGCSDATTSDCPLTVGERIVYQPVLAIDRTWPQVYLFSWLRTMTSKQ